MLNVKPILKQKCTVALKPLDSLKNIDIFALPSKISEQDIMAMFKGVLSLMREKVKQEQTEKYLRLKLQYTRLKYLYNKKIND